MIAPAAGFIEMGAQSMRAAPGTGVAPSEWIRDSQRKELHAFGDGNAQRLGASGISDDFRIGYELGLQTARVYLAGNPAAVIAKVSL